MSDTFVRRMVSRRDFLKSTASLSAVALLAGCTGVGPAATEAGAGPAQEMGEVTFALADWYANKHLTFFDLADEWNETFPDRPSVNVIKANFDAAKTLLEAQKGDSSFDAHNMTGIAGLPPLIEAGAIGAITDLVPQEMQDDIVDFAITESTYEGDLYIFPVQVDTAAVNCRKQLLADAGHPDGPGEYWEDLLATFADIQGTLTMEDGSPVFGTAWDPHRPWRGFASVGLGLLGPDGFWSEDPDLYMNWGEEMGVVLEHCMQLMDYSAPETFSPGDTYVDVWARGQAATMFSTASRGPEFAQQTFGLDDLVMASMPKFKNPISGDGTIVAYNYSAGTIFFEHGPHWQDAAEFMVWCYDQPDYHKTVVGEGGWVPVSKRAGASGDLPWWVQAEQDLMPTGVPGRHLQNFSPWVTGWAPVLQQYLKGEIATTSEALELGQAEVVKAVKEARGEA